MAIASIDGPPWVGTRTRGRRLALGLAVLWAIAGLVSAADPGGWSPVGPSVVSVVGTTVETVLFAWAARRRDLSQRLRQALLLAAIAVGMSSVLGIPDVIGLVTGFSLFTGLPAQLLEMTTYVVATAAVLWMPMAPHDRASWLRFGLDTVIACGGLLLVFVVAVTLPGVEATGGADRSQVVVAAVEMSLMVIAVDVLAARGVTEPSRVALMSWLAAQAVTAAYLTLGQYVAATSAVSPSMLGAIQVLIQIPFLVAATLYLTEPAESTGPTPAFALVRWFNPLPVMAMVAVGAAVLLSVVTHDARALAPLAIGLVVLVGLTMVRLIWSLVDNARMAERERAALAARVETVGRLAGGVAHEFNNLMTAMLLNLDMVQATAPDALRDSLAEIRTSADESAALTRKLLAYAGRQVTQRAPHELFEAVEHAAAQLRASLPASLRLKLLAEGRALIVELDPAQLHHLLRELVLNACDAVAAAGTIKIRISEVTLATRQITPFLPVEPGRYGVIEVEDHGEGIAPDVLPWICDPFYSTRRIHRGGGLGLAAVRGIIAAHGGGLAIESIVGKGTTVRVYLPAIFA